MLDLLQAVDLWLVDRLVVPASLHDVEGRFVHMNAAAERASGRSNADMLGRRLTALLPPEPTPLSVTFDGGDDAATSAFTAGAPPV